MIRFFYRLKRFHKRTILGAKPPYEHRVRESSLGHPASEGGRGADLASADADIPNSSPS